MEAVSAVVDLETLLKPISDENPAGKDLRYEILDQKKGTYWYDKIKEAHRENLLETVPKFPDWPTVVDLSIQALSSHSKDLQIAAWLSDALVGFDQFDRIAGLRDSLKLMRGLIDQYWEHLFPEIDPEGDDGQFTARGNVIAAFDGNVALALRGAPLTNGMTGLKYSYLQWEEAKQFDVPENLESLSSSDLARVNELKEQAAKEGKITGEDWRKAVNSTPYEYFKQRLDLLNECAEELKALDQIMGERFQREAPAVRSLQKSLDDLSSLARNLEKEKRPPDLVVETAADAAHPEQPGVAGPAVAAGKVGTRQEALRKLAEVADYFRQAEPHSPVSYLVQRAISWGNMPLENWLEEVVKDSSVLGQLRETLGIKSE